MAKPISYINKKVLTEEEQKQQMLNQLSDSLLENSETIINTLKIMKDLNDIGILPAVHNMMEAKEDIVKIILGLVNREPVTNIINNLMGAAGMLSAIDPELLGKLLKSLGNGMAEGQAYLEDPKKIGLFDLMKVLKDPDINRAMGFGIHLLKGLGQGLGAKEEQH